MSELPPEATPEAIDSEPVAEATPEMPPAPDYSAISAATEAHAAAVKSAHETLAERMHNAYEIFAADLDRAYRVWEDVSNTIKQSASIVRDVGGNSNAEPADPASAR